MTWPIEKRCAQRDTHAFVTPDTVDLLGQKMIGIIGDRRVTKVHRYLGARPGIPTVRTGLRVWPGGYGGPTTVRPRQSVSVALASHRHLFEGVYFSVDRDGDTEEQVADRYHHPENQWLGQRRDITLVDLDGWPGSPAADDQIRIEYWNENGVGQETLIAFDDFDPVEEIAWDVKGDKERRVYLDDEWCTFHGRHIEDPEHVTRRLDGCKLRRATLAENLSVLAILAAAAETAKGEG